MYILYINITIIDLCVYLYIFCIRHEIIVEQVSGIHIVLSLRSLGSGSSLIAVDNSISRYDQSTF